MSRYTGPRVRVMRALGIDLPGLSRKTIDRRPYPPGDHGGNKRGRPSVFGIQLKEKQKLKMNYGLTERQMRINVKKARRSKVNTGTRLLELLESRLDNVVFRAGFAPTIPAARQLVNHGHFLLNGRKTDIPSALVGAGDVIQLREKSHKLQIVVEALERPSLEIPTWLSFDLAEKTVKVVSDADADTVPFPIDIQQVIEYYASRL
ncbi:MAG: 30S ribosomal protein S4 [Myxococcales bacterium]|nr:30S ribosomal protein S4 [Myxococcales bacterium]